MAEEENKSVADEKAPTTTASAPEAVKPAEAKPASAAVAEVTGILGLLAKGFMDWFKTPKAKYAIVGFVIITIGMAGLFNFQATTIKTMSLEEAIASGGGPSTGGTTKDPFVKYMDANGAANLGGTSQEGAEGSPQKVAIEDLNVYSVIVVLSWTDEANTARHTNQPDSFEITVTAPDGRKSQGSGSNPQGGEGSIEVTLTRDITKEVQTNKAIKKKTSDTTWSGDWNITVKCTAAGDQEAMFSIIGLRDQADSGNQWTLDTTWTFKAEP